MSDTETRARPSRLPDRRMAGRHAAQRRGAQGTRQPDATAGSSACSTSCSSRKGEDGVVAGLALADIDSDGELDLMEFEGASSGLLGQDDYDDAGGALEPGASAAILLYENRWARPFAAAVSAQRRAARREGPASPRPTCTRRPSPSNPRTRREENHNAIAPRSRPRSRDLRNRDRGLEPRLAPTGEPVGAGGPGAGQQRLSRARPCGGARSPTRSTSSSSSAS